MQARQNLLLDSLSTSDIGALGPHLKPVRLEQGNILYEPGDVIETGYFPTSAVISLVVTLGSGQAIEAAMVGNDGLVGAACALDGKTSLSRAVVQIGGEGLACNLDQLKRIALNSHSVLSLLVRHEQTVYAQAQQSAACNIVHPVEARLARWMLRARDLSGSDTLPFTQEFLAEMLGVSRTSVSLVAHTLQQAGMIQYKRGKIQIVNREAMEETACECYATVKSHYSSFLGYKQPDQH
jgi:CRP-like cAMP-binding protein